MIRLSLFISILLIGLNMAIAKNNLKSRHIHQKQFSRNNEQLRTLRNLVGKLIDTDTNTIYHIDGQKQEDTSMNLDATTITTTTTTTTMPAPMIHHKLPHIEETACIAACHTCIEDYSLESRKKKAADNCGPMCDCADSCMINSAEQVGQTYGQNSNNLNDKNCWWKTYTEILSSGLPSLA